MPCLFRNCFKVLAHASAYREIATTLCNFDRKLFFVVNTAVWYDVWKVLFVQYNIPFFEVFQLNSSSFEVAFKIGQWH